MFAIPHSDDVEEDVIDGCPVVDLQDAVDDVQIMLRALYDRSYVFFYKTPMPITVLAAFLRMGKKYAIQQLFEEAKRRLSLDSPPLVRASTLSAAGNTSLFPRISGNDPFNFAVMNIANEAGLFSTVVMATFYICLACPPSSLAHGYEFDGKRCTLSASNTGYCLLGQRHLADVERLMIQSLAYLPPACQSRQRSLTYSPCSSGILSALRSFQDLRRPFSVWDPVWDDGLCVACRAELRRRHEKVRTELWMKLPVVLGLDSWEDLGKDSENS